MTVFRRTPRLWLPSCRCNLFAEAERESEKWFRCDFVMHERTRSVDATEINYKKTQFRTIALHMQTRLSFFISFILIFLSRCGADPWPITKMNELWPRTRSGAKFVLPLPPKICIARKAPKNAKRNATRTGDRTSEAQKRIQFCHLNSTISLECHGSYTRQCPFCGKMLPENF